MKVIRDGVFETNSSSAHCYVTDDKIIPIREDNYNFDIEDEDFVKLNSIVTIDMDIDTDLVVREWYRTNLIVCGSKSKTLMVIAEIFNGIFDRLYNNYSDDITNSKIIKYMKPYMDILNKVLIEAYNTQIKLTSEDTKVEYEIQIDDYEFSYLDENGNTQGSINYQPLTHIRELVCKENPSKEKLEKLKDIMNKFITGNIVYMVISDESDFTYPSSFEWESCEWKSCNLDNSNRGSIVTDDYYRDIIWHIIDNCSLEEDKDWNATPLKFQSRNTYGYLYLERLKVILNDPSFIVEDNKLLKSKTSSKQKNKKVIKIDLDSKLQTVGEDNGLKYKYVNKIVKGELSKANLVISAILNSVYELKPKDSSKELSTSSLIDKSKEYIDIVNEVLASKYNTTIELTGSQEFIYIEIPIDNSKRRGEYSSRVYYNPIKDIISIVKNNKLTKEVKEKIKEIIEFFISEPIAYVVIKNNSIFAEPMRLYWSDNTTSELTDVDILRDEMYTVYVNTLISDSSIIYNDDKELEEDWNVYDIESYEERYISQIEYIKNKPNPQQ